MTGDDHISSKFLCRIVASYGSRVTRKSLKFDSRCTRPKVHFCKNR